MISLTGKPIEYEFDGATFVCRTPDGQVEEDLFEIDVKHKRIGKEAVVLDFDKDPSGAHRDSRDYLLAKFRAICTEIKQGEQSVKSSEFNPTTRTIMSVIAWYQKSLSLDINEVKKE